MSHRTLSAADGFEFACYEAMPAGAPKGAVVVIQEIFGVNKHIREVADGYAAQGYAALAPQIFDRVERDVELGYESEDDWNKGIETAFQKLAIEDALKDLQATVEAAGANGKVGVVGYCFGSLLTWLSACEVTGIAAASSYYGGGIVNQTERSAKCPVMMHFGELDSHIPMSDVESIKAAQPSVDVYVYDADHGFNCDHRGSYNEAAAKQAVERTLSFFAQHVG